MIFTAKSSRIAVTWTSQGIVCHFHLLIVLVKGCDIQLLLQVPAAGLVDETMWIGAFKVLWQGITTDFLGREKNLASSGLILVCRDAQNNGKLPAYCRNRSKAEIRC